jgi:hypothetical protein
MKKTLLTITAIAACAIAVNAQSRMILYEEFTGENCPPCAAYNPGLWSLVTSGTNPSKIEVIKYMSPIPSAGQFYNQNKTQTNTRISFYAVPFAPYGLMDGLVPDPSQGTNAGNIANFTQADIDAESAIPASFNIDIAGYYTNATKDSVTATINITCVTAYTGAKMALRTALVETVNWATAPGTNGEKDFENVVRTVYPTINGTTITNTWTAGQTQTITIKGPIPTYVDTAGAPYLVAWIQNGNDKTVEQAAKSAPLSISTAVKNVANVNNISLYPNPAKGNAVLSISLTKAAKIQVQVIDEAGRTAINMNTIQLAAGTQNINISTGALAAGLYTVKIVSGDGVISTQRLSVVK